MLYQNVDLQFDTISFLYLIKMFSNYIYKLKPRQNVIKENTKLDIARNNVLKYSSTSPNSTI